MDKNCRFAKNRCRQTATMSQPADDIGNLLASSEIEEAGLTAGGGMGGPFGCVDLFSKAKRKTPPCVHFTLLHFPFLPDAAGLPRLPRPLVSPVPLPLPPPLPSPLPLPSPSAGNAAAAAPPRSRRTHGDSWSEPGGGPAGPESWSPPSPPDAEASDGGGFTSSSPAKKLAPILGAAVAGGSGSAPLPSGVMVGGAPPVERRCRAPDPRPPVFDAPPPAPPREPRPPRPAAALPAAAFWKFEERFVFRCGSRPRSWRWRVRRSRRRRRTRIGRDRLGFAVLGARRDGGGRGVR